MENPTSLPKREVQQFEGINGGPIKGGNGGIGLNACLKWNNTRTREGAPLGSSSWNHDAVWASINVQGNSRLAIGILYRRNCKGVRYEFQSLAAGS